jgi:crossover junction endodeoxyribonuclease RuvC
LMKILKFEEKGMKLDATDGLAAALCHFYQSNIPVNNGKYNSWKEFVNKNPDKII